MRSARAPRLGHIARETKNEVRRRRGLLWTWVVLGSGIGLVALVVADLRASVRARDARAAEVALSDAERGARELRGALTNPAVLDRLPAARRFAIADGALVIPAELGWLDAPPAFEPALDALARDRLARAERAVGVEARELWDALRADPTLRGDAQEWVTARVAWFAWRSGDAATRDALLAELDARGPAEVGASTLLLCARAGVPAPDWARAALPRLPDARADAVLARLAELGVDVDQDRALWERARALRTNLRQVRPLAALFAATTRTELRVASGALFLYFPARAAGARLSFEELAKLVDSLTSAGLEGAPPLDLGGTLSLDADAAPVVEAFAGVRPEPVLEAGLASGATGLALLAVALAAVCGGGAFLALRGARREAEAARLRGEFVTGVTHELKTPLAGIRLTADLLLDGHVRDEAGTRKHLGRLAGEALRLGVLIENVLDLGRLERGERGLDPRPEDVGELTAETLALFEPLAARDGVELAFERPAAELVARVDRDALRQALLNVLDNARKYGGAGGRIEVALERVGAELVLSVRDRGRGVPTSERALVFERFRRAARDRDGSIPGVGLGLYLARTLVRRQAGELACVTPPDGGPGARFELRFPTMSRGEGA